MKRGGKAGGREDDGALSPIPQAAKVDCMCRRGVKSGDVVLLHSSLVRCAPSAGPELGIASLSMHSRRT